MHIEREMILKNNPEIRKGFNTYYAPPGDERQIFSPELDKLTGMLSANQPMFLYSPEEMQKGIQFQESPYDHQQRGYQNPSYVGKKSKIWTTSDDPWKKTDDGYVRSSAFLKALKGE